MNLSGTVNKFRLNWNHGNTSNPVPSESVLENDSCVENGKLVSCIPENQSSATSQDPSHGAFSQGMSENALQLVDRAYTADSENIQLHKSTAPECPSDNENLKNPSKDDVPNQNAANENASSISLDTDEVIDGFNTIFDFINGASGGTQMSFENNLGVSREYGGGGSKDDGTAGHDFEDDCLNRLSSLSLEPNSKDQDVDMNDVARHSFSEAVEISILVSS